MSKTRESAEILGLKALAWLAGNEELCPVFLGATGASVDDLRAGAANPEYLGSILDFLLQDDSWIVAFCDAEGLEYTEPYVARQNLPGGEQVNWT